MKQISKAIIILVLFVGIGNVTTLLNASDSTSLPTIEWEVQQRRPHHDRPFHKGSVMNKHDFEFLYKVIKQKSFKNDRLELLSVGVLDNYFSCKQCVKIMSLCSFDSDKLEILDIMAKHIADLEHADLILESFTFDSNREKAAKALGLY